MKNNILLLLPLFLALMATTAMAQDCTGNGFKKRLRVGYSLGATTPMGIPEEVREIKSYSPKNNLSFGLDIQKNLTGHIGVMTGLRVENKGMEADVDIKAYNMQELRKGTQTLAGYFTGGVKIDVTQWMLTIPLMATFDTNRFQIHAGPYLSRALKHDFSGYAYDGYLRQDTPQGAKVNMGHSENDRGDYDLSSDLRGKQFGIMVGTDLQLLRHLGVFIDLSWGLTGIFEDDFKTIEQTLYPIFGTVGAYFKF